MVKPSYLLNHTYKNYEISTQSRSLSPLLN
uniref:Uncharacterized protein n=1 Tax=Arundo donax TaxID=35708 RepID=A0A0A9ACA1_ARUDO